MLKCDLCGKEFDTVRRIAVDKDYDRLSIRHEIKYSCPECFKKKEESRKKQETVSQNSGMNLQQLYRAS
ncbi:MAG: hypothetical protein A2073_02460 [Deltaproteobacteria bacterium GWC2_42_11]|nr:MAG: hypothetical protein A2073_02460 [Deltaproteobacteria bacterium GWC2_42_11]HBO84543.1 hypothetical protein [Deltaproteobacteria bacterium]